MFPGSVREARDSPPPLRPPRLFPEDQDERPWQRHSPEWPRRPSPALRTGQSRLWGEAPNGAPRAGRVPFVVVSVWVATCPAASSESGERCTLPTLVTRGSLIFKEMIIFLTGGLSLVLLGAGPGGGGGVRVRGRDATANRGRRRVGLAAFARPGPWRAPVPFVCLFV